MIGKLVVATLSAMAASLAGRFNVYTTWNDLLDFVMGKTLDALMLEKNFIDAVDARPFMTEDESSMDFLEHMVDMFHDRFGLSSAQRKNVRNAMRS